MKPEKPALGISRSNEWEDAMVYHVECECSDPDHAVVTWIEIGNDPEIHNEVEVTFYVQTNFSMFSLRHIWSRIKIAVGVLFGRGYQQHHSLILKKQAALNFGAAIEQTIQDLEDADTQSDS